MKKIEVTDTYGEKRIVDEDTRKLYTYNNKKKKATYTVKEVGSDFWCDYILDEEVTDIEAKMKVWNSRILLAYARNVKYNSNKYDPDNEIWDDLVKHVKENEDRYFDEYGDYKENYIVTDEDIREIMKRH